MKKRILSMGLCMTALTMLVYGTPRGLAQEEALGSGKMYWTDTGTKKIQRANLDGTQVEDLITGLENPHGIALDLKRGKMYWTDISFDDRGKFRGKIQRANLDGSQIDTLITGLNETLGIALDLEGGKMYWMDRQWHSRPSNATTKIQRVNLDGSQVEDLITLEFRPSGDMDIGGYEYYQTSGPLGIVLDLEGGKMYWTDAITNKIQCANLNGSQVQDLITPILRPEDIATKYSRPRGIALDLEGGKMYWTDYGTDKIWRANLDGSQIEGLIIELRNPRNIAQKYSKPRSIALDLGRGKMYWTDPGTDKIQRANLDGSQVEDLIITGLDDPYNIVLDLEGR